MRILLGSTLFFGIGAIAALHAQSPPHAAPAPVQVAAPRLPASPILGYKSWKRVNQEPHPVTSRIAMMCRTPTQEEIAAEAADPHLEPADHPGSILRMRYVVVYVNKTAQQAILHEKRPTYPEGSLIVKERLATPHSAVPELITVMHKREKGYNPGHGDWEYLTLDGAGKQITAQGRLQKCESCHAEWKKTDFTSRAYLSDDVMRHLQ
jgi:hypothetical protein